MSRPFAGSPLDGFFFSGAFFGPIGMSVKIVSTQDTVGSDSGLGRGLKQAVSCRRRTVTFRVLLLISCTGAATQRHRSRPPPFG